MQSYQTFYSNLSCRTLDLAVEGVTLGEEEDRVVVVGEEVEEDHGDLA